MRRGWNRLARVDFVRVVWEEIEHVFLRDRGGGGYRRKVNFARSLRRENYARSVSSLFNFAIRKGRRLARPRFSQLKSPEFLY